MEGRVHAVGRGFLVCQRQVCVMVSHAGWLDAEGPSLKVRDSSWGKRWWLQWKISCVQEDGSVSKHSKGDESHVSHCKER